MGCTNFFPICGLSLALSPKVSINLKVSLLTDLSSFTCDVLEANGPPLAMLLFAFLIGTSTVERTQ
jgi:hypothetical protein